MDARFQKSRLIAEVELYLAVVEVFRDEGCDPRWSAEPETPVRAVRGAGDGASDLRWAGLERG
jgi:hypothetical protein